MRSIIKAPLRSSKATSAFTAMQKPSYQVSRTLFTQSNDNKKPINYLEKEYKKHLKPEETFCLDKVAKEWKLAKIPPLWRKEVLVNAHLTTITCQFLHHLKYAGGANISVTASPRLVIHDNAMAAIKEEKIPFYPQGNIPPEKKFDLVFDCGGFMAKKTNPTFGMVELTHTDPNIYRDISFPVVTVDRNSKVKEIETGFGTGDAFLRVLEHLSTQTAAMAMMSLCMNSEKMQNKLMDAQIPYQHYLMNLIGILDIRSLYKTQKYMFFGYGKVGEGMVKAMLEKGVKKENITIIEVSPTAYMRIKENGCQGILLDNSSLECLQASIEKVNKTLVNTYAVITATGVENAISKYFNQVDFQQVPLLINMGTPDEFGANFSPERVVCQKKTANLELLAYPTGIPYLDAIFALMLKAGEEMIIQKLEPGLHDVSPKLDKEMLSTWLKHHGDSIWQYNKNHEEFSSLLSSVREKTEVCSLSELQKIIQRLTIFNKKQLATSSCFLNPETPPKSLIALNHAL